jgi:hypothetical protein
MPIASATVVYNIDGDSTHNGVDYKKLRLNGFANGVVALLREDTMTGRVWYKGVGLGADTNEHLVMDLGMQKGDTIHIATSISSLAKEVDSVYTQNGRKHVRFSVPYWGTQQSGNFYFEFVEGAGTALNFTYKDRRYTYDQWQLCSYHDSVKVHSMPIVDGYFSGNCFPPSSVEEEVNDARPVRLYPNPAGNVLHIELPEAVSGYSYRVVNAMGQKLMGAELKANALLHKTDIGHLAPGQYYLQLLDNDKPAGSYLFSKQ